MKKRFDTFLLQSGPDLMLINAGGVILQGVEHIRTSQRMFVPNDKKTHAA
jgi:hypothetical protein